MEICVDEGRMRSPLLVDLLSLIQFNLLNQKTFKYTLKAFLITFFKSLSVWL